MFCNCISSLRRRVTKSIVMKTCLLLLLAAVSCTVQSTEVDHTYYDRMREILINAEQDMRTGSDIKLDQYESVLNTFVAQEKRRIIEESRINRTEFIPALSFYKSKSWIENSLLFKIIKKMPKGGSLHLHDSAITSLEWVVSNLTYRDYVYMCVDQTNWIQLAAFKTPIDNPGCSEWRKVNDVRRESGDVAAFDRSIVKNISMLASDPLETYPTLTSVWTRFDKYFDQVGNLLSYWPVREDYFLRALDEARADGLQYVELRGSLSSIRDENDVPQDAEYNLKRLRRLTKDYKKKYPDFVGIMFIKAANRGKSLEAITKDVKLAMQLRKKYPDFVAGYDLVSQEDTKHSLYYFIDALLLPSQQDPPEQLPYFFHAAETDWQENKVDYNLVDAVLLNATRIGHGFALDKHPLLIQHFKVKRIAVELNPISNQLLGLVSDLRDHPGAPLIAQNVPVVVCSDDPSTWEADMASHDWYITFMDLTGEDSDLKVLKQFAINSFEYSGMNRRDKDRALAKWSKKWKAFIRDILSEFKLRSR